MDETESLKLMSEEMEKPKKERNKALILKAQIISFKNRRQFLPTVRDGNLKAIVDKYPKLGESDFVSTCTMYTFVC